MESTLTVIVHGGARKLPSDRIPSSLDGVKKAAMSGYQVLMSGGSAVDAVVSAVSSLEDNSTFNAGHGAVLNKNGEIELDAVVIDGSTLRSGAVCSVRDIANPVQLARAVMDKTDHCLLSDQGANAFAEELGIPRVDPSELVTPEARQDWEKYVKYRAVVDGLFSVHTSEGKSMEDPLQTGCDTVGAVALDRHGNIASATSTGGITAKRPGRVGDCPIIGSGAYADNESCGVSTTGHGESIMKVCLARRVGEGVERGLSMQEAADAAMAFMKKRVNGAGGLIAINKTGEIAHAFSTQRMAWASIHNGIVTYGIDPGQKLTEAVEGMEG